MKINTHSLMLLFSVVYHAFSLNAYIPSTKMFYGTIQYPISVSTPPPLFLFYQGQQIDSAVQESEALPKKGTYEIVEDKRLSTLYIVITPGLQHPKNNEIMALETTEEFPYRLFKLTRKTEMIVYETTATTTTFKEQQSWDIQELNNENPTIKIPENSIIFFMDPTFISIKEVTWAPDDAIYKLPTIVFNDTLDAKTLETTATKLLLSSCLDFRPLHKKVKPIQKMAHNRIISVPGPKNRFIG